MVKKAQAPIWAPWRIDYIRSPKGGACFLCGLERPPPAGSADDLVIVRGKTCCVIMNRYPYNSGHLMIVPYRHFAELTALSSTERKELTELTILGKELLDAAMQPEGYNLGMNLGAAAGAGLEDHLHQHLVPRWKGDTNFMAVLGDARVVPEALAATAALLRQLLGRRRRGGRVIPASSAGHGRTGP